MKKHDVSQGATPDLISFSAWLSQIGRSDTTGWRWAKAGWLHPINVCGRLYLTGEDIRRFQARAAAGEFAKRPAGAAARSRKVRIQKEAV